MSGFIDGLKEKGEAMKNYDAEVLSTTKYRLGESPFYDGRSGRLSFVDIIAGNFYFFSEKDLYQRTAYG